MCAFQSLWMTNNLVFSYWGFALRSFSRIHSYIILNWFINVTRCCSANILALKNSEKVVKITQSLSFIWNFPPQHQSLAFPPDRSMSSTVSTNTKC